MDLNSQNLTQYRDEEIAFIDKTFKLFFNQNGYALDRVDQHVIFYREPQGRQIGFAYTQRGSHTYFESAGFLYHNGAGHGDSFHSVFDYLKSQHSADFSSYSFNNPDNIIHYPFSALNEVLTDWYQPVISQPDFGKKLCEWILEGEPADEAETFFPGQLSYLYRLNRLADGYNDVVGSKLEAKAKGAEILDKSTAQLKVDLYPEVSAFLVYKRTVHL